VVQNLILNAVGFVPVVFEMIEKFDNSTMSKIAMLLWTLWWRRNKKCWNEKLPTIFEVIRRSQETSHDWQLAQQQLSRSVGVNTVATIHKWLKQALGSFKCNLDTTCYVEDNNYSVGACIRDSNNHFVQAFAKKLEGTPSIAEAMGVLEVLQWIHNTHYGVVQIETDFL
jgi:hypothetical protein